MKYFINPTIFSSAFSLPSSIVDSGIKVATESEIKVILYLFRHFSDGIDLDACANCLGYTVKEVENSLVFWINNGVISKEIVDIPQNSSEKAITKNEKPNRLDVAKRGVEDKNFALILHEAQMKFSRSLKSNESTTLLYIYEDLGLDISVILYLLQYALNENKLNIRFIEKTAVNWVNSDVKTVNDAEKIVVKELNQNLAWKRVEKAFGIEHRKPSKKEIDYSLLWLEEWKLTDEYLVLAYNVCVDNKSKFIFSYCAKIIENWRELGFTTVEAVNEYLDKNKPVEENNYAGYDISLYEQMLDNDD